MNRRILRLAIPNIISNITIPLLGMVDIAIAGRLGEDSAIGAIAIGTTIFNMIYWACGFLRMGTSGITAQAYGARDLHECTKILVRSLFVAVILAVILVIFRLPIGRVSLDMMSGSDRVQSLAGEYFFARIWAAPASLSLFAIHGWFIGMQNSKTPMVVSVISNIVNLCLGLLFVFRYDMGIAGIAWATVIAQYSGLAASVVFWFLFYGRLRKYIDIKASIRLKPMMRFFNINKDIFLRTLCLVTAYTFFTAASSRFGDTVLATNALLMQLFTLFSYMSDGFAYAAESLTGKYIGAKNINALKESIRKLLYWSAGLSMLYIITYLIGWRGILSIFSSSETIIEAASQYIGWIIAIPVVGFLPFLVDGILLGATQTKLLRNTMFFAIAIYFAVFYSTVNLLGNNAVWLAFITFIAARGVLLLFATHNLNAGKLMKSRITSVE